MSYCSDVRAIIYGPTDVMQRFIAASKLDKEHRKVFEHFIGETRIFTVNAGNPDAWSVLDMQCDDVKWHPEFADVKAWHSFMQSVENEEDWEQLNYEFVRIGEEHGDVEWERSDDCDYILSVTRPVAELDIARSFTTEGFPDETDNRATSQE